MTSCKHLTDQLSKLESDHARLQSDHAKLRNMLPVMPVWLGAASQAPKAYAFCIRDRLSLSEDKLRLCERLESREQLPAKAWDAWLADKLTKLTKIAPIASKLEPVKESLPYLYDKCVRRGIDLTPNKVQACGYFAKFLPTQVGKHMDYWLYSALWKRHRSWNEMVSEIDGFLTGRPVVLGKPRIPFQQLWMAAKSSSGPIWKKCLEQPACEKDTGPAREVSGTCEMIEDAIHSGNVQRVLDMANSRTMQLFEVKDPDKMEKYLLGALQAAKRIRQLEDM